MAIFNQSPSAKRESTPQPQESALPKEHDRASELSFAASSPAGTPAPASTPRAADRTPVERGDALKESLIAADLTIEGKIEGAGHIRLAGRFKGDVHVQGDLTIEHGAKLTGGVRARKVMVAGELEGNIESAQRLELLDSGVLVGDVKAGSVIVASGSRMRGQVEFGWEDKPKAGGNGRSETGTGS